MRIRVVVVGRAGRLLAPAIAEYEARAARYWNFDVVAVKEESARSRSGPQVRAAEGERILQRVADGTELIALTRTGSAWSSSEFARELELGAVAGRAGFTFAIGGAFGLSEALLQRSLRRLRLSSFTLPHDLARLLLAEQLYRAGTIVRGEPYHKAAE